jgi:hypothetical protein
MTPAASPPAPRWLLAGSGAIGSLLEALLPTDLEIVFADADRVAPENLGIAAFAEGDLHRAKADVLAERYRGRGGLGRALLGDVAYSLRPGLVRTLAGAVLALDGPRAIESATRALWGDARPGLPVVALGCGGEGHEGAQARVFAVPGGCAVCGFGEALRRGAARGDRTSCAAATAPRASAASARSAAALGARLVRGLRAGDETLVHSRFQLDARGLESRVRLPAAPSPRCPVPHGDPVAAGAGAGTARVPLGGGIHEVSVGELAARAVALLGEDAEIVLEGRALPMVGLACRGCGRLSAAPPILLPAAVRSAKACDCLDPLFPLGTRARIGARELLRSEARSLLLADWGAGPGDEFTCAGDRGEVRLACDLADGDLG